VPIFALKSDLQEMHNLAGDVVYAERLTSMQARFETTRVFYGDTDETVWQRGPTKRYPPETYIRSPTKR